MSNEHSAAIGNFKIPEIRLASGDCQDLMESIRDEGLRHPIVAWKDGTLLSGRRRLIAHIMLQRERIPTVFVSTIEEAAKQLRIDFEDTHLQLPWTWSDKCRFWGVVRELDALAAALRFEANRKRGIELHKQTKAGRRDPGRMRGTSEEYFITVMCEPFGFSAATAKRVETIYRRAQDPTSDKHHVAVELMKELDAGAPVWPAYEQMMNRRNGTVIRVRAAEVVAPQPAPKQLTGWEKALPQLEGLTAGLLELGPPNSELTAEQVGPVQERLMAVRRNLEKIIKQMRETHQS